MKASHVPMIQRAPIGLNAQTLTAEATGGH